MLETKIQELIDALNANTAAHLGKAPTPAESPVKADKPSPKKEEAINQAAPLNAQVIPAASTVQEWRALAQKLLKAGKKSEIDKINAKHSLKRITEAHSTDKAAAVFADLNAAVNAL